MTATLWPDLARGVVLLAAGGLFPSTTLFEESLARAGDADLPMEERLAAFGRAYFEDGSDPSLWWRPPSKAAWKIKDADGRFLWSDGLAAGEPAVAPADTLITDHGPLMVHPFGHASLVLEWRDRVIAVDPVGDARDRFSVRFYVVAMLFIVFDIEVVFMYPWAVMFTSLGLFGFIEMGVFILILLVGYAYVWKKGALEWE